MGRNLKKLGERTLETWGAQDDLIVNSSRDQDETGWDFFLEWPLEHDGFPAAPSLLDPSPSPLQCLIQVKSTDRERKRWPVKLSNWLRFVESPLPTFFLVLEFERRDECQRAYLVHVGETYIERVLERIREITAHAPNAKLHQHTMDFTWNDDNEIAILHGTGLTATVHSYIPRGVKDYVAHKQRFLANVGYDKVPRKLRIKPRLPDAWGGTPDELLVDFALGIVPHLEIETGEVIDLRFGIPAVLPDPLPTGTLHILDRVPAGRGRIRLHSSSVAQELLLDAEVYLPHGVEVGDEHVKVRYSIPFVDMIFGLTDSRKVDWKLKLPSIKTPHQLADLQPAANLIMFLYEATSTGPADIKLQVTFDSHPFRSGRLAIASPPPGPLVEWAGRAKNAWTIARFFEIEQDVSTSAVELVKYRRQLHLLASILRNTPAYFQVEFPLDEAEVNVNMPWCVPLAATARLGQFLVQASFIVIGHPKPTREILNGKPMHLFQSSEVQRLEAKLYRDPEVPDASDRQLVKQISDLYEDEMQVLLIQTLPWLKR
jgi:hypothetical protein